MVKDTSLQFGRCHHRQGIANSAVSYDGEAKGDTNVGRSYHVHLVENIAHVREEIALGNNDADARLPSGLCSFKIHNTCELKKLYGRKDHNQN